MAGRMIRVISAHVFRDVELEYGMRSDYRHQYTFWKRLVRKREEPKYQHDEHNCWSQQHIFFLFFMLLGNGFDTMPYSMRFALELSGGLYLIYQLLFSLLLTFPLLHAEMFLGRYSGLTNTQMYRMMPISFGICVLSLFQNILYAGLSSPSLATALMGAMNHFLKTHWACPPDTPLCYDYIVDGPMLDANCTMKHLLLHCDGGKKRLIVTMYIYCLEKNYFFGVVSRTEFQMRHDFQANWKFITVITITWIFIITIVNFKMRILELCFKILTIISIFMHLIIFLLATTTTGISAALVNMYDFRIRDLKPHVIILCAFLMPVRHNVLYGGGFMTYAASIKYNVKLGLTTTAVLLLTANYAMNIYFLLVFHAVIGVVGAKCGVHYKEMFFPSMGMYYALVSEFLRSLNCPHIFIALYHFTNWLLECSKLTIIIRMHINGLYDFFPAIVQFGVQTRAAWVIVCTFIGLVNSMGICVKLINELLWMVNLYMMNSFQLSIRGLFLFYGYGVSRLNDDLHFYTGKKPIKFWRIVWYCYPFVLWILQLALCIDGWKNPDHIDFLDNDLIENNILESFWVICFSFNAVIFFGLFIISFLYVVLQMRQSKQVKLTTPLFFWGPPNKEARKARKGFTPSVAIRSRKLKKYRQRFRELSIRQQHERDNAERVKRGRLFIDKQFFANLGKSRKERSLNE